MNVHVIVRMILGGAICGSFSGILAGGVLGALYGLVVADISRGLDGALLGGIIMACAGAVYGAFLGLSDETHKAPAHASSDGGTNSAKQSEDASWQNKPVYGPEAIHFPENRHLSM